MNRYNYTAGNQREPLRWCSRTGCKRPVHRLNTKGECWDPAERSHHSWNITEMTQERMREALHLQEEAAYLRLLNYAAILQNDQPPIPVEQRERDELLARALMTERGMRVPVTRAVDWLEPRTTEATTNEQIPL